MSVATAGGKSHVAPRRGMHFINAGALTRHHVWAHRPNPPKSWLLTFTEGDDHVRVQCYMHTDDFLPRGWYAPAERTLTLHRPFRR